MPTLHELKGTTVILRLMSPVIEQKHDVLTTRLVEIENHGIWIEGRDLANYFHESENVAMVPKMPLFFVPFAQIAWIHGSADYPSLSEKQLGI